MIYSRKHYVHSGERQTETDRRRETDRQRDRQTEREREIERDRERERERGGGGRRKKKKEKLFQGNDPCTDIDTKWVCLTGRRNSTR